MKVFFYALIFHLTLNVYVFWRGWHILSDRKKPRAVFATLFLLEFLVYLVGLFFYQSLSLRSVYLIWNMGTTWMLFVFYMAAALVVIDVVFEIHRRRPFLPNVVHSHPKRTKGGWFVFSVFFVVAILLGGRYRFNNPAVTKYSIEITKPAGEIDSIRVVMAGDLHLGYLINKDYAKKYVDLIMAQKPDLILFAGDIVDAEIKPLLEENIARELRRLYAPLGVYTCTGNHEYRYEAEEKIAWLNQSGITVLRDSSTLIRGSFYVVGREDINAPHRKQLKEILDKQHVDTSLPVVVLDHNPSDLDENSGNEVDLAMYGHTHNGQFFPGNIITNTMYEVAHGYKKRGNTHVVVTSGLGLAGPQYRIGTTSEVVVLNIKFGKQNNYK